MTEEERKEFDKRMEEAEHRLAQAQTARNHGIDPRGLYPHWEPKD